MKVLSILQPWASLVVTGHKTIETRSWATKYRGELLIHASAKKMSPRQLQILDQWSGIYGVPWHDKFDYSLGAIIGKVKLVAVEFMDDDLLGFMQHSNSDNEKEFALGDWGFGRYAWHLENPILFNTPIPAKGQLNLWNFDIESRESNDDDDETDDDENTPPDYYQCMICSNVQSRSYSCDKCAGPMSEFWY